MKKAIIVAAMIVATLQPLTAYAEEPKKMYTTAYCQGVQTCTGKKVREGYAAVSRDHVGEVAIVYRATPDGIGEIIGYFECEDTGEGGDADGNGIGAIREGKVIDVYRTDLERCREWMRETGGKVYVQFVKADG